MLVFNAIVDSLIFGDMDAIGVIEVFIIVAAFTGKRRVVVDTSSDELEVEKTLCFVVVEMVGEFLAEFAGIILDLVFDAIIVFLSTHVARVRGDV